MGADTASSAKTCGTVRVVHGHTMRVTVIRGHVGCALARSVIRYSLSGDFTPGDLPDPWTCRGSSKATITCTMGRQTVRGRAIYY